MHVEASDNFGVITQEPPTLFSQRWPLIGLGLANLVKMAGWRAPKSCLCPLFQCRDNKHIPKLLVSVFLKVGSRDRFHIFMFVASTLLSVEELTPQPFYLFIFFKLRHYY